MRKKWGDIQGVYFVNEGYGTELFGSFLQEIIDNPKDFRSFFNHVVGGEFHQHYESHFICMPEALLEEGLYEGSIEISWNNFDGEENLGKIALDKFCFLVKLSAVFHSKYVDRNFDPWKDFKKLDDLVKQYLS